MQQASGSTAQSREGLQYLQSEAYAPANEADVPAREPRSDEEIGVFPWPFGSSRQWRFAGRSDATKRRQDCPPTQSRNWKRVPRRTSHNTPPPALHVAPHHHQYRAFGAGAI